MIDVELPDGSRVTIDTDDPQKAVAAGRKIAEKKAPILSDAPDQGTLSEEQGLGVLGAGVPGASDREQAGILRSAAQGIPLVGTFADEIEAGFSDLTHEQIQTQRKRFDEANPGVSTGLEVGTGLLTAGPIAKIAAPFIGAGANIITRGGRAGVAAAGEGIASGAGRGDTAEERLGNAAQGGGIGGITGGLLGGATSRGRRLDALPQPGRVERQAGDRIADTLQRDARIAGRSEDLGDIAADLGEQTQRTRGGATVFGQEGQSSSSLGREVFSSGGEGAPIVNKLLRDATRGEANTLGQAAEVAFETRMPWFQVREAVSGELDRADDLAFGQIAGVVPDLTPNMRRLINQPRMRENITTANKALRGGDVFDPANPTVAHLGELKRVLAKSGVGENPRVAGARAADSKDIDEFLTGAVPGYASANAQSSVVRGVRDAGDMAREMFSETFRQPANRGGALLFRDTQEFLRKAQAMTPDQKDYARVGALEAVKNQLRDGLIDENKGKKLWLRGQFREKMKAIMDPAQLQEFDATIANFIQQRIAKNIGVEGSQTANKFIDLFKSVETGRITLASAWEAVASSKKDMAKLGLRKVEDLVRRRRHEAVTNEVANLATQEPGRLLQGIAARRAGGRTSARTPGAAGAGAAGGGLLGGQLSE